MSEFQPQVLNQSIGDTDLTYLSYDGVGPPVIFLHATGFVPCLWHPVARKFSPDYRVIAPCLYDHRRADPEAGGLPWELLAADIAAFCNVLHIERPYLVGHSMGAVIATIAHAHFGLAARGMVLIEPIFLSAPIYGHAITVRDHPIAAQALRRTNFWQDESDAANYLNSKELFKHWDQEILSLYIRHGMEKAPSGGLQLACPPEREAALFMGGTHFDPWPLLPRVTCPVLVLEGEKSDTRRFIDLRKATSLIPRCSHRIVPNAGHLIPMERPAEVAALIRDFVQHSCRDI
jgi:lipase